MHLRQLLSCTLLLDLNQNVPAYASQVSSSDPRYFELDSTSSLNIDKNGGIALIGHRCRQDDILLD